MSNLGGTPQPGQQQPDPRNPFSYLTDKERESIGRAAKAQYNVATLTLWVILGGIGLFLFLALVLVVAFFALT